MLADLFVIFEPLVHSIPIKRQILFIALAFIIWCLVGPDRIFFKSITHSHGVVGRIALVSSIAAMIVPFQ